MNVARNASSVIMPLVMLLTDGSVNTGVAFDDEDLVVSMRLPGETEYSEITLVDGTVGTYVENGWKEVGLGEYEFCPANSAIVPGKVTLVRVTYGANPMQRGTINAVGEILDQRPPIFD